MGDPNILENRMKEYDFGCKQAISSLGRSLAALSYYAPRMKQIGAWEALGFKSERQYYESLGISRTLWRSCKALGEGLDRLTLDDFMEIPAEKLKTLARVKPEIWEEYPWIATAKACSLGTLKRLVEDRNAAARPLGDNEKKYYIPMPASHFDTVRNVMRNVKEKHGLETRAESLILMMSVYSRVQSDIPKLVRWILSVLSNEELSSNATMLLQSSAVAMRDLLEDNLDEICEKTDQEKNRKDRAYLRKRYGKVFGERAWPGGIPKAQAASLGSAERDMPSLPN